MKYILFLLLLIMLDANAASLPSTTCPDGYIAIEEPYATLATECSSGMIVLPNEYLFTDEPCSYELKGICIMYAPVGVSYTDASGTYEFTEACPL